MNQVLWFPHLLIQRSLGVKDLTKVNFKATLVQPAFGELKAWQPKLDKPDLLTTVQATGENLDNKREVFLDRGARNPELTYSSNGKDIVPVRGEPVHFEYKGYSTFLFQEEYDLLKDILPNILEITINTTDGLSPLFQILAIVKED